MRRLMTAGMMTLALAGAAEARQAPPAMSQNEFVPVSEIPPEEQIPAPLIVGAAYGFAWVAVIAYIGLLVRRVGRVERDLAALERQDRP